MSDEPITAAQFSKLAGARSKIYGLLSTIYLKIPNRDFVRKLTDKDFGVKLASLAREDDLPKDMRDGVKIVEDFIKRFEGRSSEELRDDLSVEYTRLFRGVKPFYGPPPPYESVYVDGGLVMGESTVKVKKKYAEAGVGLQDNLMGEPPDHIGFELEFMHHLCCEEAGARREDRRDAALKYLEMEKEFLSDHLMRWAHKFCDTVVDAAKLDFYRGMAKITKGFIRFDHDRVDALISTVKHVKR